MRNLTLYKFDELSIQAKEVVITELVQYFDEYPSKIHEVENSYDIIAQESNGVYAGTENFLIAYQHGDIFDLLQAVFDVDNVSEIPKEIYFLINYGFIEYISLDMLSKNNMVLIKYTTPMRINSATNIELQNLEVLLNKWLKKVKENTFKQLAMSYLNTKGKDNEYFENGKRFVE